MKTINKVKNIVFLKTIVKLINSLLHTSNIFIICFVIDQRQGQIGLSSLK